MRFGLRNEAVRNEWIARELTGLRRGSSIIDIGAGAAPYKNLCGHLDYKSQDFCQYNGQGDRVGLQNNTWDYNQIDYVSEITSIPVVRHSFDAILCSEVIEHVPDPIRALDEMSRILKPSGTLLITAPFNSLTHQSPFFFCTGFSEYFYKKHLGELGFKVEISHNGGYFEYLAQELFRLRSVANMFTKTPPTEKEAAAIDLMQQYLARLGEADQGSSELLCFGLHIKATR